VAAAVSALAGIPGVAHARLEFPSVSERVAGARLAVAPAHALSDSVPARVRVECGDVELFGIAGLRAGGVRATASARGLLLGAELVHLGSPVGAHTRVVAEAGAAFRGAWAGVVRAGVERLALDGFPGADTGVVGLVNRIDVGRVFVVADVEAALAAPRTSEVGLALCARAGPARLVASVRIDDGRLAAAGASLSARLHPRLAVSCGYDDASTSLRAAALVRAGGVEVGIGAFQHPVLGGSQGVSVAWVR
jgi:hypothetical protein